MFWSRWLALAGVAFLLVTACSAAAERPYASYPEAARARYEQAEVLRRAGEFRRASAAYEEAIGLGMQEYARAHLRRAECQGRLDEHARAVKLFTAFLAEFDLERACRH